MGVVIDGVTHEIKPKYHREIKRGVEYFLIQFNTHFLSGMQEFNLFREL